MTVQLSFLGAARGVTGSATLLDFSGAKVLVDCAVVQGDDASTDRNCQSPVADPKELSAVVLTHGHLDHVGRPLLTKLGFDGVVFGHPATLAFAEVVF